ncbi:protein NYNRIN-like [Platichthys flesus]|uniref:protein NYNRIN-like n=1 Tax=Platichthys flesus TaxID=8260 RepID=UPI002DBEAB20|nr:protein NYNRIN-like [Platichthys flesus]
MPTHTLTVLGKDITFLVDSGATHSVIKSNMFETPPKMSGRFVRSVGASGSTVVEKFTTPLICSDSGTGKFKCSFLLSSCCPINLMGRDVMCLMGISLISTPSGVVVVRTADLDQPQIYTCIKYNADSLLYAYEWKLCSSVVTSINTDLVDKAHSVTLGTDTTYMHPEDLHCIAHIHEGKDSGFEKRWFRESCVREKLTLSCMFWNEHRCAVSVILSKPEYKSPSQFLHRYSEVASLYDVPDSHPHVSLSKHKNDEWQDLGPWIKKCVHADVWEKTSDLLVQYNSALKVYRKRFTSVVHTFRTVQLVPDTYTDTQNAHAYLYDTDNISETHPALKEVPKTLWAQGNHDVGLIRNMKPVVIKPKSDYRPHQSQYPLRQEAIDGITPVFNSLLKAGVIVPCKDSPVRTPIFPVKKVRDESQPDDWRFVQDLKAVNAAVQQRAPSVPNPYTILSQVPPASKWFSVVDLANAFFSVQIDKDSQYWFAFEFNRESYTFTRLCQGYCESPTIYNQALKDSLSSLEITPGSALLQYVDDLMICAPTKEQCEKDTVALLKHLDAQGHKASLKKLQFVKEQVSFLGHVITAEGKSLSPKRALAIQNIPKPVTKKQVMSFLGMCSYCRSFIPNYAVLEAPLSAIAHGQGLQAYSKVTWTDDAEKAFTDLKLTLQTTPTLGLPNPDRPFTQAVDEKGGYMTSVLLQEHGGKQRPVAFFSAKLDPVAAGLPTCLRAVAAAEKAVMASRDLVGYSPLTLLVPHAVSLILLEQKTSHLSAARWLRYHAILLEMPNITVKRCNVLNPATLLPTEGDGEQHNCVVTITEVCSPRPDLQETPLQNPDLELFVDGSASCNSDTGANQVGFSVVTAHDTLIARPLPASLSAQAAELTALIEACKLAKGKRVNIYTDSRYAFGVVHDFGTIWKHREFLTSSGKPIAHHALVSQMLDAVLLPKQVAVCKCDAHTSNNDPVSQGNARADAAAKAAACQPLSASHILLQVDPTTPTADLQDLQLRATADERGLWKRSGCTHTHGVWVGPEGKPCLPKYLFPHYAKLTHGKDHVSKGSMMAAISQHWFTKGFSSYAQKFCQACMICATNNIGRGMQAPQAAHPPPDKPFDHLQMDFIELTPSEGKKYCLVIVDMFSKWVEVFPTSKQDTGAVVKALITELIPRWGIPSKISSDNGTPFVSAAQKQMSKYLGFDLRKHCAYHPASAGAVERENGTLKNKLAKCCEETGLSWPKALPLVLMQMRMRVRPKYGLSPFEILFGRPANTGIGPVKRPMPSTSLCEDEMLCYCTNLSSALSAIHKQVKDALPTPATGPLHDLKPGDWVVVKDLRRKSWRHRRWTGPYQILLTTHTAVKVAERTTWIHASHCKRVPEPEHPPAAPTMND